MGVMEYLGFIVQLSCSFYDILPLPLYWVQSCAVRSKSPSSWFPRIRLLVMHAKFPWVCKVDGLYLNGLRYGAVSTSRLCALTSQYRGFPRCVYDTRIYWIVVVSIAIPEAAELASRRCSTHIVSSDLMKRMKTRLGTGVILLWTNGLHLNHGKQWLSHC